MFRKRSWLLADIEGVRCAIVICADFWVPGTLIIATCSTSRA